MVTTCGLVLLWTTVLNPLPNGGAIVLVQRVYNTYDSAKECRDAEAFMDFGAKQEADYKRAGQTRIVHTTCLPQGMKP